jgi:hypothetical protein
MKKYILILLLIFVATSAYAEEKKYYFSIEYKDEVDIFEYFPLEVGNKWIYENTHKESLYTKTWVREITVLNHYLVPEGKVISREVIDKGFKYKLSEDISEKDIGFKIEEASKTKKNYEHYLIQGNYIYILPDGAWDDKKKALTENSQKVLEKEAYPEFFFPISKVHFWSARWREEKDYIRFEQGKGRNGIPSPGKYYWHVTDMETVEIPYGKVKGAYHLIFRTAGGSSHVWFKDKIGVVKETYSHSGTYWEGSSLLKKFKKISSEIELK